MSVSKDKRNKSNRVKLAEMEGRVIFLRTALAHLYLTANGIVRELTDPSEVASDKKLKALAEWNKAVERYINVPNQSTDNGPKPE